MRDHPPFNDEQAAAAVAAEEAARARTMRQSGSSTIVPAHLRSQRSLWPLVAVILPASAALIAVALVMTRTSLERDRRPAPATQIVRNASASTPTPVRLVDGTRPARPALTVAEEPASPITPIATRPSAITITDVAEPLVAPAADIPVPVADSLTAPTANQAAESRLHSERLARLDQGIDLLTRDLNERERVIAATRRKLTFLPDRQPPLGAREQLAEAQRHWDGATTREREKIESEISAWQSEIRNLERMLTHHDEVAASLRKRLKTAHDQRDAILIGGK